MLLESGQDELAIQAWEKGLTINPIEFTERIRMLLANIYRERRASQEMIGLVKGYVTENNFDPEIYIHQPFASAVPRWIHQAIGRRSVSNIEKLLGLIEEMDELETLSRRVEDWGRELHERFSLSTFEAYRAART